MTSPEYQDVKCIDISYYTQNISYWLGIFVNLTKGIEIVWQNPDCVLF